MLSKKTLSFKEIPLKNIYFPLSKLYSHKISDLTKFSNENIIQYHFTNNIQYISLLKAMIKSSNKLYENIKKNNLSWNYRVKKRKYYIKKINEFFNKFKFKISTFYIFIFLMDYIFIKKDNAIKYHLKNEDIILGTLFLSIKFNEDYINIPSLKEISNYIFPSNYFSIDKLKLIEIKCLQILNYEIIYYTNYDYLTFFFNLNVNYSQKLKKECFQILNTLIQNSNEYIFIETYSLCIGILNYANEKLTNQKNDINLINKIKFPNNIKIQTFIENNLKLNEQKNNNVLNHNNGIKKIISKFKNHSQSLIRNQINQRKKFITISNDLTLNSKSPSIKKYKRNSSISTSSDDKNLNFKKKNCNKRIFIFKNSLDSNIFCNSKKRINTKKFILKKNISEQIIKFPKKFINTKDNNTIQDNINEQYKENGKIIFSKREIYSQRSTINVTHSSKYNLNLTIYSINGNTKLKPSINLISNFENIWNKFYIKKRTNFLPKYSKLFFSSNLLLDKKK
jgi:hypothetical protein